MNIKKLAAAAAIALTLAACASSGVKVTEAQTSGFIKGETTRGQVLTQLGSPTLQSKLADGTSMVIYSHAESSVRASTFIPIVGAFVGGADTRSNTVTMRFDQQDKLIDVSTTESAMGTGTGLASGGQVSVPNQPRATP